MHSMFCTGFRQFIQRFPEAASYDLLLQPRGNGRGTTALWADAASLRGSGMSVAGAVAAAVAWQERAVSTQTGVIDLTMDTPEPDAGLHVSCEHTFYAELGFDRNGELAYRSVTRGRSLLAGLETEDDPSLASFTLTLGNDNDV